MCNCASFPWGYAYPASVPLVLKAISTHVPQEGGGRGGQRPSFVLAEDHC